MHHQPNRHSGSRATADRLRETGRVVANGMKTLLPAAPWTRSRPIIHQGLSSQPNRPGMECHGTTAYLEFPQTGQAIIE